MKQRLLYLISPIIALFWEILPYGAVCRFANPEGEPWRVTFSYFDLIPLGYANFAPFLTALTTCVIIALLTVYLFCRRRFFLTLTKALLGVGVILSLCPLLFGLRFFTVIGAFITLSFIAELLFLHFQDRAAKATISQ